MTFDQTNQPHAPEGPQADLPEAPPGVPEGHDAGPADPDSPAATRPEPGGADAAPDQDAAAVATETSEPAEAYAVAGEELQALTAQAARADEYLTLAQRTQADFENYRKRSIREAAAAQERGAVKLAMALLPAVDNLERALAHAPGGADEDGFVSGIKHVHTDLLAALEKAGIEGYLPEGEAFDPTLHEAVAQQPIEGAQPGTVVEVFQRGYRIGETVVRPARVVVAG